MSKPIEQESVMLNMDCIEKHQQFLLPKSQLDELLPMVSVQTTTML